MLPFLSGCIYSREISLLRSDVERALDVDLHREIVLTIGPSVFHGFGWIARRVPNPFVQMAGDLAGDIDRVKVGVFTTDREPESARISPSDLPRLKGSGWEVIVRTSTESESVWVMALEGYGGIRNMLVMSLSGTELVIVRIEGHLEAMVERVMADPEFVRAISRAESYDG